MAHHSSDNPLGDGDPQNEERLEQLRKLVTDKAALLESAAAFGPTDRYPEPKLGPHDEGELRFGVTTMKDAAGQDKVVIDFGAPVHSIGLTREQALNMGRLLITSAGCTCRIGFET